MEKNTCANCLNQKTCTLYKRNKKLGAHVQLCRDKIITKQIEEDKPKYITMKETIKIK